jgi:citrate synthase
LLQDRLDELVPIKRAELAELKKTHGDKPMGTCTVAQAIGGMRSVKSMIWETSLLDAEEGIRFRGLTIPELNQQLPLTEGAPTPEGLLWLLLTGEVPTARQAQSITDDLATRAAIPADIEAAIRAFPKVLMFVLLITIVSGFDRLCILWSNFVLEFSCCNKIVNSPQPTLKA